MTFLDEVTQGLLAAGRSLEVDVDLSTIDVSSPVTGGVLAVVRPFARSVTFYVVHPVLVPADAVPAVSELVVRATADLLVATLELDLATGAVAARTSVSLGDLELADEELGELFGAALEDVETAGTRYRGAVDDVLGGVDPRVAATAVRRAPVEELSAD